MSTWVPIFGAILSTGLGLAPLGDVLRCRRNRSLGEMNPDVFPLLFGNGVGWVIYACCTRNAYVFAANFTNVLVGMSRVKIETMTILMLGLWSALSLGGPTRTPHQGTRTSVVGVAANAIVLLLFASPLSTIATVLRDRSAASINMPFALVQILNCSLWELYGLHLGDVYIWGPNAIGLLLGMLQVGD
ncbi:sugar efflux transporter for intercellular exchange-domain-containing protein [Baffinella frigidus]|nr:sugar efflux transporter for intercellular exchange-domain-containing protein [Cryptophyta sp. CCMP2293]